MQQFVFGSGVASRTILPCSRQLRFGYVPRVSICFGVGDTPVLTNGFVVSVSVAYALAANICHAFAYVLEFFFGFEDAASRWNVNGRRLAFFAGTALAMLLAFFAAFGLALAQFPDRLG